MLAALSLAMVSQYAGDAVASTDAPDGGHASNNNAKCSASVRQHCYNTTTQTYSATNPGPEILESLCPSAINIFGGILGITVTAAMFGAGLKQLLEEAEPE